MRLQIPILLTVGLQIRPNMAPNHLRPGIGFLCYCLGKSTEGAKEHRRGCKPPVQVRQTTVSPERATDYGVCLMSSCICLCRPFGASFVVAFLPGVCTPVCALSSLRDFGQVPISCFSFGAVCRPSFVVALSDAACCVRCTYM